MTGLHMMRCRLEATFVVSLWSNHSGKKWGSEKLRFTITSSPFAKNVFALLVHYMYTPICEYRPYLHRKNSHITC